LIGNNKLKAHVETKGNPPAVSTSSSNAILGCTSNPDGGILLQPLKNCKTSCNDIDGAS